jgi:Family of unknown function (DUF6058)
MTPADVAYVRANYVSLQELCESRADSVEATLGLIHKGRLPQPSYVLPDGTEMVPPDYFENADEGRAEFERRFLAAGGEPAEVEEEWQGYLSGAYGVCLKSQTPENIVRKESLVREIDALLAEPRPADPAWSQRLRGAVNELDGLERPFAPHYDRARWGPSSRDRCITAPRARFPQLFLDPGRQADDRREVPHSA